MRKVSSHGSAKLTRSTLPPRRSILAQRCIWQPSILPVRTTPFEASVPSHGICISSRIGFNPAE